MARLSRTITRMASRLDWTNTVTTTQPAQDEPMRNAHLVHHLNGAIEVEHPERGDSSATCARLFALLDAGWRPQREGSYRCWTDLDGELIAHRVA